MRRDIGEVYVQMFDVTLANVLATAVGVRHGQATWYARNDAELGRNGLCTCGSGKKLKRCHGTESS